jgi:hypothetical protein
MKQIALPTLHLEESEKQKDAISIPKNITKRVGANITIFYLVNKNISIFYLQPNLHLVFSISQWFWVIRFTNNKNTTTNYSYNYANN